MQEALSELEDARSENQTDTGKVGKDEPVLERYLETRFHVDLAAPSTQARCRRVCLLVFAITVLSLGDLVVTWIFLNSFGMQEANPLAAFIIRQQSPMALVLFKFGSLSACVSTILIVRHRRQGEIAAWIAATILVLLTVRWAVYTHEMSDFNNTITIGEAQQSDHWLQFGNRRLTSAPLP